MKKNVFTTGGKGGPGKTTFISGLAEWYQYHDIPCVRLDLDTENKVKGSFSHFFPDAAKIDIQTRAGLDAFIDHAEGDAPILLSDMGAGSGKIAFQWFDTMYESVSELMSFTAVGVITSDPATVESVLTWAARLQDRVSYVVVLNKQEDDAATFSYWEDTTEARNFRKAFRPHVLTMDSRLPALQHGLRNHGVTLGAVADRKVALPDLSKASHVIRAQAVRRQLFAELDRCKEAFLP